MDWHTPHGAYINGAFTRPTGGLTRELTNPATGQVFAAAPESTTADIDRAAAAARRAFDTGPWPRLTPTQRADALRPLLHAYTARAHEMGSLITRQMGAPATFTPQTTHPRQIIDYYTDDPEHLIAFTERRNGHRVTREPVGVVGIITPWNMPQKTILMKLIPALVAGCTTVVKPAPATPLDALALADLIHRIGLPDGVVNVTPAANPTTAQHLAEHDDIDKIAFTGSTRTGAIIGAACGRTMRRCSLELGGKSAMVLMPDAPIDKAAATFADQCIANNGQLCSNLTRILVHRSRHTELVDALTHQLDALTVGDPTDPATDVGPLASHRQLTTALAHMRQAAANGARIIRGGTHLADRPGYYFNPALIDDTAPDNPAFTTEIFAPAVTITRYTTDAQAIRLANTGPYGLDGAVWSDDPARAAQTAAAIRTGTIRINGAPTGIDAPLGGFKRSGVGRELGPEGLAAFTETKVTA